MVCVTAFNQSYILTHIIATRFKW